MCLITFSPSVVVVADPPAHGTIYIRYTGEWRRLKAEATLLTSAVLKGGRKSHRRDKVREGQAQDH